MNIYPTSDGDVYIYVPADSAQDKALNGNLVSTTIHFVFDGTPPNTTISSTNNPTDNPSSTFLYGPLFYTTVVMPIQVRAVVQPTTPTDPLCDPLAPIRCFLRYFG
jgi:hypothetical protein